MRLFSVLKGHDFGRAETVAELVRALAPGGRLSSVVALVLALFFAFSGAHAQKLSPKWEELTAGDFVQANRFRSYFKKAVAAAMADLDVLIVPTSTNGPVFALSTTAWPRNAIPA